MELSIVFFVVTILTGHKRCVSRKILLYFSFQALVSRVLVIGLFFSQMGDARALVCWAAIAKLGLGPSHHWFIRFAKPSERFSNFMTLRFIFVFQKVLPICFLVICGVPLLIASTAILFRRVAGLFFISIQQSISGVILGSSMIVFRLLVFRVSLGSIRVAASLFFIYSAGSLGLIVVSLKYAPSNCRHASLVTKSEGEKVSVLLIMLLIRGFPPRPIFLIKITILSLAWEAYAQIAYRGGAGFPVVISVAASVSIIAVSAIAIFSYINLIYSLIFMSRGERAFLYQWERFKSGERENVIYIYLFPIIFLTSLFLGIIIISW